ncbi:hypothetical protein [Belnapia rosea]|uniref:DUF4268 domain-containing protein n=1 Tax=Belnapia rosea TaxID=938405 RepID=A0A1G6LBD9_9PROT|nr:hypothetical protein [Belnapia rosea]SDC40488.1 hypothetical protein SAMN04487779_1001833 [Belnapia rosea]
MARQHCPPVLLPNGGGNAVALLPYRQGIKDEAEIQMLVHEHPSCLPIGEIDPMFLGPVAICRELQTPAGPIDNFMVTPSGLPVLVECKLWRNPEGRREVVGQILDYAKELSRWSSSDLQREVRRRLKLAGNPLLDLVRAARPDLDEIEFNDALTANLRRGRFLLLIVGDGIREGVEAIAEYLQEHAGLHFSLGLVEMPIFVLPDGSRLLTPRLLLRTAVVTRTVISVPDGYGFQEEEQGAQLDADRNQRKSHDERFAFWAEFLNGLELDDPEQPRPRPAKMGYLAFPLPAPQGSSWLTVFRDLKAGEVGVFLSANRDSPGELAMRAIAEDWPQVRNELGGVAQLVDKNGRPRIIATLSGISFDQADERKSALLWLQERVNSFVNVLRPRVRSAVVGYRRDAA